MRAAGVLDSTAGLAHNDHLCWCYDDPAGFRQEVARFIEEGLRQGQQVVYTADAPVHELADHLVQFGDFDLDELVATRRLALVPIAEAYPGASSHQLDQAERYAAATREALAEGFTGLRTAADATALVDDFDALDDFVRYEHRIDRLMAEGLPFTAMCAYDRRRLDVAAVEDLACIHPLVHGTDVPFRLYAAAPGTVHLCGEIDAWDAEAVRRAFDRALDSTSVPSLAVDCSDLTFLHHRGLLAIDQAATRHRVDVILAGVSSTVSTMIDVMELRAVRSLDHT